MSRLYLPFDGATSYTKEQALSFFNSIDADYLRKKTFVGHENEVHPVRVWLFTCEEDEEGEIIETIVSEKTISWNEKSGE